MGVIVFRPTSPLEYIQFSHDISYSRDVIFCGPRQHYLIMSRTKRSKTAAATSKKPVKKAKGNDVEATEAKDVNAKVVKVKQEKQDKYFLFVLENGNHKYFDDANEADEFYADMGMIVTDKKSFATKKAFEESKKALKKHKVGSPVAKKGGVGSPIAGATLSPSEQASVEKIKLRMEQNKPTNRLELHWKTTPRSSAVVVVLRTKDISGKDMWCAKPKHLIETMPVYAQDFPDRNDVVQAALLNLKEVKMRDPSGGPEVAMANVLDRNGKKITYYDHVAFTSFPIPYKDLESTMGETAYIEDVCTQLGEALKKMQISPTYQMCLEAAVPTKFWNAMTKPSNGQSFVEFLKDCKIKVHQMQNINTHVVLEDAKTLTGVLWDHMLDDRKYSALNDAVDDVGEGSNDDDGGTDDDDDTKQPADFNNDAVGNEAADPNAEQQGDDNDEERPQPDHDN